MLLNIRKPLALGYVMVKNMSQKQMNEKMTLAEAKEAEMTFFQTHPYFGDLCNTNHSNNNRGNGKKKALFGVENLVFVLTKLLVSCIKRSIPVMIDDLKRLLKHASDDLAALGTELPVDLREQQSLLVKRISTFCQLLRHSARGEYRDPDGVLAQSEDLRLHAKVQNVYMKLQSEIMDLRPVNGADNTLKAGTILCV